jgi:hypothetical protein
MWDDIEIERTKRELEPEEGFDSRNLINEEIEGVGKIFENLLCKQLKKEGYQIKGAKLTGTGESEKTLKTWKYGDKKKWRSASMEI